MKLKKAINDNLVLIAVSFLLGVILTNRFAPPVDSSILHQGDEVVLTGVGNRTWLIKLFEKCDKVTVIALQAASTSNRVWLLFQNCIEYDSFTLDVNAESVRKK